MPVLSTDLKLYGSLQMPLNDDDLNGGAIDVSNEITGELGEVFNDAYSDEPGGSTYYQYRKVFFKNTSVTSNLDNAVIWVHADPQSHLTIALESVKDGNNQSANRLTAPAETSFEEAETEETALEVPDGGLEVGEAIGVWLKLAIPAGESPLNNVLLQLSCKGLSTE